MLLTVRAQTSPRRRASSSRPLRPHWATRLVASKSTVPPTSSPSAWYWRTLLEQHHELGELEQSGAADDVDAAVGLEDGDEIRVVDEAVEDEIARRLAAVDVRWDVPRERQALRGCVLDAQRAVGLRPPAQPRGVDVHDRRDLGVLPEHLGVAGDEACGSVSGQHLAVEGRENRLRATVLGPRSGLVERDRQFLAGHALDEVDGAVGGDGAGLPKHPERGVGGAAGVVDERLDRGSDSDFGAGHGTAPIGRKDCGPGWAWCGATAAAPPRPRGRPLRGGGCRRG
ncbi:Uncharacterised protein [Prescottella equi]|nr:Uncharacterised protein [Prescottella equi]